MGRKGLVAPRSPARTYYKRPFIDRLTGHYTVAWQVGVRDFETSAHVRLTDYTGRLPSLYSVVRLPASIKTWFELRHGSPPTQPVPWLVYDAIRELRSLVGPTTKILEIGGGNSTLWFLDRGATVVCVETSEDWARDIEARATQRGTVDRLTLEVLGGELARSFVLDQAQASFDLLLVDSLADTRGGGCWRPDFVVAGRSKVRRGGYVVLDNSDHPQNWVAAEAMLSCNVKVFTGFTPMGLTVDQTTFWQV